MAWVHLAINFHLEDFAGLERAEAKLHRTVAKAVFGRIGQQGVYGHVVEQLGVNLDDRILNPALRLDVQDHLEKLAVADTLRTPDGEPNVSPGTRHHRPAA